jgi:Protein of unknown function (DUF2568)
MAIANLTLRFILEVAGIVAFGYWGFQVSTNPVVAALAAAAAVAVWALVVAPRAPNRLSQSQRDVVGTAILLLASAALAASGLPVAGGALGAVVVTNAAMLAALGPGVRDAFASSAGRVG